MGNSKREVGQHDTIYQVIYDRYCKSHTVNFYLSFHQSYPYNMPELNILSWIDKNKCNIFVEAHNYIDALTKAILLIKDQMHKVSPFFETKQSDLNSKLIESFSKLSVDEKLSLLRKLDIDKLNLTDLDSFTCDNCSNHTFTVAFETKKIQEISGIFRGLPINVFEWNDPIEDKGYFVHCISCNKSWGPKMSLVELEELLKQCGVIN